MPLYDGVIVTGVNIELLAKLSEVAGVPGREERVREIVLQELKELVDWVEQDAMGNLIAFKDGTGAKKVMFSAHMDEIGFIVKHIDPWGFLYVQSLGGFDNRNLFAKNVVVHAKSGDLPGILHPNQPATHILSAEDRKKVPELSSFAVDLGLPAEKVAQLVQIGDPITLQQQFREMGDFYVGKAMDDRVSVFVLLEVLRALKGKEHYYDIYAVFSTQEEVGLRGALTATHHIEPDIGIALDVTLANDISRNVEYPDVITKIGHGVAIKVMDALMISNRWLVDEFIATAEKAGIKYQLEVLPFGGTDGGAIQRSRDGVPTITISLPTRYVHTIQEAVHKDDLQGKINLLLAWLQSN